MATATVPQATLAATAAPTIDAAMLAQAVLVLADAVEALAEGHAYTDYLAKLARDARVLVQFAEEGAR